MAEPALPEVSEATATGAVAALYARIRRESGAPLVNFVWRHLATLPGRTADWAWEIARTNAGRLPVAALSTEADRATAALALAHPVTGLPRLGREAQAILTVYNRNNTANLARVAAILAALEGPAGAEPATAAPPAPDTGRLPPLPDPAALCAADRAASERLEAAGPAATSGVVPSLWRHLVVQPGLVPALAQALVPVLAGPAFATAWARLRAAAAPPAALWIPPAPAALDREGLLAGAGAFAQRIAELALAGRIVTRWCGGSDDTGPVAEEPPR
ncbi:MAG: hypothetical protein KJZ85_15755 [Rhodobacteraceae bacterium]|nr:hypothetical protein [Paracoccaceae bacterium]